MHSQKGYRTVHAVAFLACVVSGVYDEEGAEEDNGGISGGFFSLTSLQFYSNI